MNKLKINQDELEKLQYIHSHYLKRRLKNMDLKGFNFDQKTKEPIFKNIITSDNVKNLSKYYGINYLYEKTTEILNQLDLINQVDLNQIHLEFHARNCFETENEKFQWSAWHCDDYAAVNFEVYTVIYYIRKDITVRGGNLKYVNVEPNTFNDYDILDKRFYSNLMKRLFTLKVHNSKIETHEVKAGDVLVFPGYMYHLPEPTYGFGCRDIIVIFIKRKINKS